MTKEKNQNEEGPQALKATRACPLGKANQEIWGGTERRHGERSWNLVLCHHYKTLAAYCLGWGEEGGGKASRRSRCVGVMASAGWSLPMSWWDQGALSWIGPGEASYAAWVSSLALEVEQTWVWSEAPLNIYQLYDVGKILPGFHITSLPHSNVINSHLSLSNNLINK